MRVEFKMEGGLAVFPGLSAPRVLESSMMAPEDAATLARLLEESAFFRLPPTVGTPQPGAADIRRYTISASDGEHRNQVSVTDPIADPRLAELVAFLSARPATR